VAGGKGGKDKAAIARKVPLDRAEALLRLAEQALLAGDARTALAHAERALALAGDHPNAHAQKAQALATLERWGEAVDAFAVAQRLAPATGLLYLLSGNARRRLGMLDAALDDYRLALTHLPHGAFAERAGAYLNAGLVHKALDQMTAAASNLRAAIALDPQSSNLWNALGAILHAAGHGVQAEGVFRRSLCLADPSGRHHARAEWNLALGLLLRGQWGEGFALYERRASGPHRTPPPYGIPFLLRAPQPGARILVSLEQGLGDMMMVVRFLPLMAAQGVRIVLQRPLALRTLFAPDQVAMRGVESFLDEGESPAGIFDGQIAAMSLPALFWPQMPQARPYLAADPQRLAAWRDFLRPAGRTIKVGFVWAGNPDFLDDAARSPGLSVFLPLMRLPGVTPVIIQMGMGRHDPAWSALPSHALDPGPNIKDMADTAALIADLDLLVSCCTSPVHLAGAMGLPVALTLPFMPDWRWGLHGETTPWYPSVTLYRQAKRGDWSAPVAATARRITALVEARAYTEG
jgi:tetratricopeptide (TPR) repeat protein